jgi:hypothetical protein
MQIAGTGNGGQPARQAVKGASQHTFCTGNSSRLLYGMGAERQFLLVKSSKAGLKNSRGGHALHMHLQFLSLTSAPEQGSKLPFEDLPLLDTDPHDMHSTTSDYAWHRCTFLLCWHSQCPKFRRSPGKYHTLCVTLC